MDLRGHPDKDMIPLSIGQAGQWRWYRPGLILAPSRRPDRLRQHDHRAHHRPGRGGQRGEPQERRLPALHRWVERPASQSRAPVGPGLTCRPHVAQATLRPVPPSPRSTAAGRSSSTLPRYRDRRSMPGHRWNHMWCVCVCVCVSCVCVCRAIVFLQDVTITSGCSGALDMAIGGMPPPRGPGPPLLASLP
jgi:hypothetical protein